MLDSETRQLYVHGETIHRRSRYAIDGEVRGARWFSHHKVFEVTRKKVVASIALDAIAAKAETRAAGRPLSMKPAPAPIAVDSFVKNVEAQAIKDQRDTPAANVNEYKESSDGFGSKTMTKGGPTEREAPQQRLPEEVTVFFRGRRPYGSTIVPMFVGQSQAPTYTVLVPTGAETFTGRS